MAERKNCQGLNSKCFLITYLAVVGFLLLLWSNGSLFTQQEYREIPKSLAPYIISPPKELKVDADDENEKSVLTSSPFEGSWVWVYFSHANCSDSCSESYKKLSAIRAAYANNDIKIVIIDLDGEATARGKLAKVLNEQGYDYEVVESQSEESVEAIAQQFEALFLRTNYDDGSYLLEQQHDIFLVDPKARVYARFNDQTSASEMKNSFVDIRQFYAKSE